MAIERFTTKQFEEALPKDKLGEPLWVYLGMIEGERAYAVTVKGTNKRIHVRSSIDGSGIAANSGEDSIRQWVEYNYKNKWFPLKRHKTRWTTRVPGWRTRMTEKLRELWALAIEDSKKKPVKKDKPFAFLVGDDNNTQQITDDIEQDEQPKLDIDLSSCLLDLSHLNPYQRAVVVETDGPRVVEACPGSGKTRTAEHLVANLLELGKDPSRIGVFTFSRKGAEEARWRIARTLWPDMDKDGLVFFADPGAEGAKNPKEGDPKASMIVNWVCTIHALSLRLLKEYNQFNGSGEKIKVLSGRAEWEVKEIIKDSLDEFDWAENPKAVRAWIGMAIKNLIQPPQAECYFADRLPNDVIFHVGDLVEIYKRYMDFCKSRKLVDFDMMQARVLWLIRNNPRFVEWASDKFDYIIVDEAQDTDDGQAEILFALAKRTSNITYLGDVDQSMYRFRGACPSIMREDFALAWPDVKRYNLPVNYRSTQSIINTAAMLIDYNYGDDDKQYMKAFQARDDVETGKPIEWLHSNNFDQLCANIVEATKENPGNWFVLSRTRAECAAIHTALVQARIPAINKSGGMIFGSSHIRKVIAYARLACNYQNSRDDLEVLGEIANVATMSFRAPMTRRRHLQGCDNTKSWVNCGCPTIREEGVDYCHARYYGQKAIQAARNWNGIVGQSYETNRGGYPTLRAKGATDLVTFVRRLELQSSDAVLCLNTIITECVLPWMEAEGMNGDGEDDSDASEEFAVLTSLVEPGMTVEQFLAKVDELSTAGGNGDESQSVLIGTFHWSKGAERECVVVNLTRCPIIPPQRQRGKLPTGSPPTVEEERRLAFVGVTRAKQECLVVTSAEWNGQKLMVSPFVAEMKLELS